MTRPGYDRKTGKESMGRTGKILALAAAALALAGCGQGSDSREPGNGNTGERPLKVAATLFPYYDFARQIGGDVIDLELIVPAGMDSHSFEPTPADMRKFEEADVVILNGGVMEHWAQQVLESVGREDQTVVFMMDYVEAVEEELVEGMEESGHSHSHGASHDGHEEGHFHDDGHQEDIEYDEHIWTSPVNAIRFVEVITRVLCQEDPDHQAEFEAGRDRYVKEQKVQKKRQREQEKQNLTAVQIFGVILEVIGAALAIIGLIGEDRLLIYDALPPVILGLPLLLAKERSWLILCWVLMILSFIIFNPYTIQTAWWIPDGLIYLRRYLRNPEYSTYLFGGVVGIIRGLLVLGLLVFTGRACGRAWREKRFPDQKD